MKSIEGKIEIIKEHMTKNNFIEQINCTVGDLLEGTAQDYLVNKYEKVFSDSCTNLKVILLLIKYPNNFLIPYEEYENVLSIVVNSDDQEEVITNICSTKECQQDSAEKYFIGLKNMIAAKQDLETALDWIISLQK